MIDVPRRRPGRALIVALAVMVLFTVPAKAQGSLIEGLVKNATDINIFGLLNRASRDVIVPRSPAGASGLGFELSYDLSFAGDSVKGGSARIFGREIRIELAVGYSQSGGYQSSQPGSSLYMAVRDLPALTIYESPVQPLSAPWNYLFLGSIPYIGERTGLITLQSGHAYTDSLVYKLDGQTFQLGPVVGLSWDIGPFSLFTEGSYLWRMFPSLDWATPPKGGIPKSFPRSLDLTGWELAAGLTIELKPHHGR